jgi:hypothetical protein
MARIKAIIGNKAFERLKASGQSTFGPFASATDLCVLSVLADDSDPDWSERITLVGTEAFLAARFDLKNLPPGALFLRGEAAREFIEQAKREEMRYQREQARKGKFGGNN